MSDQPGLPKSAVVLAVVILGLAGAGAMVTSAFASIHQINGTLQNQCSTAPSAALTWHLDETAANTGSNVVNNPGFETYTTSPGIPASWTDDSGGATVFTKETTIIHGGANAVKMVHNGVTQGDNSGLLQSSLAVTAGHSYYASAWGRTGGGTQAAARLRIVQTTNALVVIDTVGTTGSTTYTKLSGTFMAVAGKSYKIELNFDNPPATPPPNAGDTVYFDDSSVQEIVAVSAPTGSSATLSGATNTAGPNIGASGFTGTAYSFDGVDDYAQATIAIPTTYPFSIAVLASASSVDATGTHSVFTFSKDDDEYYSLTVVNGAWGLDARNVATETVIVGTIAATPGTYQEVMAVFNGPNPSDMALYVNGVASGAATPASVSVAYTQPTKAVMGQLGTATPSNFYGGSLDEPTIYTNTVSSTQAASIASGTTNAQVCFPLTSNDDFLVVPLALWITVIMVVAVVVTIQVVLLRSFQARE